MIKIMVFNVTMIMTNCYLLTDEKSGKMAVVDPGGKSDKLISKINKSGGKLEYVILTHGHYDHIGYSKQLADMFGAKVICPRKTQSFLNDNVLNHSAFHPDFEDASGHFARHAVFAHFHLSLDDFRCLSEGKESDDSHDDYCSDDCCDGNQDIGILWQNRPTHRQRRADD